MTYSGPELICPRTRTPLNVEGSWLVSESQTRYPIVFGVPIVVPGVRVAAASQSLPDDVIAQLVSALGIQPLHLENVQEIFRRRFCFDQDWIQTEADQFVHRVAATHEGLRNALSGNSPKPEGERFDVNAGPLLTLSTYLRIDDAAPDQMISVNIRVKNCGDCVASSEGEKPLFLSYHWIDAEGLVHEGMRTPLLLDLPPGRELTQPIFINAPAAPGAYVLRISAVHEHVRWLTESVIKFSVNVTSSARGQRDPGWKRTPQAFEYMADHFEGLRLMTKWRQRFLRGRPLRLLELGGNRAPMIATREADDLTAAEKINVDIDPYGMIIGNLVRDTPRDSITYLVADGMNLPLQPGWADIIVMFASFHHFPDPIGLLKRLSQFLAPDGLICLISEPIGHVQRHTQPPDYLRELQRGVNEQSFALWEYAQIFKFAGLEVADCRIDYGSLKVALRRPRERRLWGWLAKHPLGAAVMAGISGAKRIGHPRQNGGVAWLAQQKGPR